MKSLYFTSKQIEIQAMAFLHALQLKERKPLELDRPALLVLDLQNYFFDPNSHAYIPSAPAILPGVNSLIEAFRKADLLVVFTRHINTDENAGMMARWWRDLLTGENKWSGLIPEIKAQAENVIDKPQYDAFFQTKLKDLLTAQSVTDLVITGVMTHLCCETTARSGFMHGYQVWFTVDGTATYNPDFHLASLRNLSHGFADPVLVCEVLEKLG